MPNVDTRLEQAYGSSDGTAAILYLFVMVPNYYDPADHIML